MQLPKCDTCGKEVKIKEGVLSISFRKIREIQDKQEEFKKRHPGPLLNVCEVMAFPSRVPWIWHHCGCNMNGTSYEIEGNRVDTIEKAMGWTLHLMEKNWFEYTDWRGLISRLYPKCDIENE